MSVFRVITDEILNTYIYKFISLFLPHTSTIPFYVNLKKMYKTKLGCVMSGKNIIGKKRQIYSKRTIRKLVKKVEKIGINFL